MLILSQFLLDYVARTPDAELDELAAALRGDCGITISAPTICRELARHGLTRKKVRASVDMKCTSALDVFQITKPALERDEELRTRFRLHMLEYAPEDLVFVDESACNRHTFVRKYGRAPCGVRAQRHDFFVKGTKFVFSLCLMYNDPNILLGIPSFLPCHSTVSFTPAY